MTFTRNDTIILTRIYRMKNFLFTLILLSATAIADDNILITDVAIKAGDQVIVFIDDIGRYVTVASEDDIKIVFDAEDVLPGRHEALVRIVGGELQTVKEVKAVIVVQ